MSYPQSKLPRAFGDSFPSIVHYLYGVVGMLYTRFTKLVLKKLESHSDIASCDYYISFVLSNLPCAYWWLNNVRYGVSHLLNRSKVIVRLSRGGLLTSWSSVSWWKQKYSKCSVGAVKTETRFYLCGPFGVKTPSKDLLRRPLSLKFKTNYRFLHQLKCW